MRVVLDTNVLLVSIPSKSTYRPIFDALINGVFDLVLTNDILSEYLEIIEQKSNAVVANNIAELLLDLVTLNKTEIFFEWNLIEKDKDDNKFVDAAIAGSADFIVSNDQHFNILKSIDFPKINIVTPTEFLTLLLKK